MRLASLIDATGAGIDFPRDHIVRSIHVNMGGTGHAGIEAADGAQDIDALVFIWAGEVLQNRRVEHRFLVRPWIAPWVPWAGVPRRGRQDLIIGERTIVDDGVMRQVAAPGTPEASADLHALAWHLKCRVDFVLALLQ